MKKRGCALLCAFALLLALSGCAPKFEEMTTTIFAMDTVMNLTLLHDDPKGAAEGIFNGVVGRIYEYERLFSATLEGSDIQALNTAGGQAVTVSADTADLLEQALALCEKTDGALDLTAYPAVKAWGFTTGEYRVPLSSELEQLATAIDYTQVTPDGTTVTLPAGMELDLGAVAKGYVGDRILDSFRSVGYSSALLDLGQSSIAALGSKPDGTPWRVGIQDPSGQSYLGILELSDQSMGTSGSYQRYFEEDGTRYCHIIDPDTAAPAQTGLASVTVVSPSCLTCDGLSTALFVMGLEEGAQFWRDHPELGFEALFITEEGRLYLTTGLAHAFTLAQGYEDREVTVLS